VWQEVITKNRKEINGNSKLGESGPLTEWERLLSKEPQNLRTDQVSDGVWSIAFLKTSPASVSEFNRRHACASQELAVRLSALRAGVPHYTQRRLPVHISVSG
jgi:hypothetical protein